MSYYYNLNTLEVINKDHSLLDGVCSGAVGSGTVPQAGRSRVRFIGIFH